MVRGPASLAHHREQPFRVGIEDHRHTVQDKIASATSRGRSSSARWPAPAIDLRLVRAAQPRRETRGVAARHDAVLLAPQQQGRRGHSGSRFSSRVLPIGQKMRAAASFARTCSIGHSIEFAPSGGAFSAVQMPDRRTSGRGPHRRAAPTDRRADRSRRTGRTARSAPAAARCPARAPPSRPPSTRRPNCPRGRRRAVPTSPAPARTASSQSRCVVQHRVPAVAAGKAGQRRHDHRARLGQMIEERHPARQSAKPARKPSHGSAALAPDAGGKAVDVDGQRLRVRS